MQNCRNYLISRTPPPVRLKREHGARQPHGNEKTTADVDRGVRRSIRHRSNHRRQDAHDAIARHRHTIAGGPVGAGKNLGRVRIKRSVVNVQAKADSTAESHVLRRDTNRGVSKEEGRGHERADNHSVPSPKQRPVAHVSGEERPKDRADVDESVVPPRLRDRDAPVCTASLKIGRQEDVEERLGKAHNGPRHPDEDGGDGGLPRGEETSEVDKSLAQGEAVLAVRAGYHPTGIQLLERQAA